MSGKHLGMCMGDTLECLGEASGRARDLCHMYMHDRQTSENVNNVQLQLNSIGLTFL